MSKNKAEKNIFIAFILNLMFSIFELVGGTLTNSVAILSDAIHDFGDAFSIGVSYILEKKSKKSPDDIYTYGYLRYSVIGSLITTLVLIFGAIFVIIESTKRVLHPVAVHYDGMILFAVIGLIINLVASYITKDGDSLNQKSVNLHMFEDVLGWGVVLIGAILMKFMDISVLDPIISIGVSLFILLEAIKNLKDVMELFLEKAPNDVNLEDIKKHIMSLSDISDVHHIHIWSIDGINNYATIHVVTTNPSIELKHLIRKKLKERAIAHATIELEKIGEDCEEHECEVEELYLHSSHHHHH